MGGLWLNEALYGLNNVHVWGMGADVREEGG